MYKLRKDKTICSFEKILSISEEEIEFELKGVQYVPWADFLLNPRRLRGSDFLMRWSQGVWSEERIIQAVNQTTNYYAIPYGPSGTAPDKDIREFELYFERLDKAGLGKVKRPDLLIFCKSDKSIVDDTIRSIGGIQELPFTLESEITMKTLLNKAIIAVECENSLWKANLMPNFGFELTPQRRLKGKLGLKKSAVLPTIIIKEEDRKPLLSWQNNNNVNIHVWHAFYDKAYGLSLKDAEKLIKQELIEATKQTFQAPGGATTTKIIYKFYYHYAYPLGESIEEPKLVATSITDKNGHILPYVRFDGGRFKINPEALEILESVRKGK